MRPSLVITPLLAARTHALAPPCPPSELQPEVAILETGTLAREFEASVKAPRILDRRG